MCGQDVFDEYKSSVEDASRMDTELLAVLRRHPIPPNS